MGQNALQQQKYNLVLHIVQCTQKPLNRLCFSNINTKRYARPSAPRHTGDGVERYASFGTSNRVERCVEDQLNGPLLRFQPVSMFFTMSVVGVASANLQRQSKLFNVDSLSCLFYLSRQNRKKICTNKMERCKMRPRRDTKQLNVGMFSVFGRTA